MERNIPKGPNGSFLLGSLADFSKDINQFMLDTSREFPDIAHFTLPGATWFLVSDPDYIKTVLVTDHRNYRKDQFFWKHTKPLIGDSLLTTNGEVWRKQRKLSAPAFHPRTLSTYTEYMQDFTERWCNKFKGGEHVNIQEEMSELTANIVVKALFGTELNDASDVISTSFRDSTDVVYRRIRQIIKLPFFVPTRDNRIYANAVRKLDKLIFKFIKEHREGDFGENTLLSALMAAKNEDGRTLTDRQLRNEVTTLFLAGHETTSLALTWTLYLLSLHPEIEARLHHELDEVLGGKTPTLR